MQDLDEILREYPPAEQPAKQVKGKILVIDDEPGVRRALNGIFGRTGYEVAVYSTGEEALLRLDETITVVVLDILLPKIRGDIIYRRIKERYDIPIIFHSAYPGEDLNDYLRLQPFDYIDKGDPKALSKLTDAIERAIHGRRA